VVACPGEHQPAARVTAPGRGVCPACGGERPIYTSSVRGRDLLAPHTIALVVS
jgi:hypothetical protein